MKVEAAVGRPVPAGTKANVEWADRRTTPVKTLAKAEPTIAAPEGNERAPNPALVVIPGQDTGRSEAGNGGSPTPRAPDVPAPESTKVALRGAPSVPLAQLYKQCESAARRGDCVVVRVMVGRITKTDRGYRTRVAKDSAIGKCLAE